MPLLKMGPVRIQRLYYAATIMQISGLSMGRKIVRRVAMREATRR